MKKYNKYNKKNQQKLHFNPNENWRCYICKSGEHSRGYFLCAGCNIILHKCCLIDYSKYSNKCIKCSITFNLYKRI